MKKKVGLIVVMLAVALGVVAGQLKKPVISNTPTPVAFSKITVTKPGNGVTLQKWGCAPNSVIWSYEHVSKNLNIVLTDLVAGTKFTLFTNVAPNHNSTSQGTTGSGQSDMVVIPANHPVAGHQYKITVATVDGVVSGDSTPFQIADPWKVVKPAAGEVWTKGQTYQINLTPAFMVCGASNLVVKLKHIPSGNGGVFPIATTSSQYNQWSYTVPTNLGYSGNQFKIVITAMPSGEVVAKSDLFTIN
jgi:hypothetical protein